jgi:Na+-translocating ferredoxin:NAD+ oxidoreductase RnfA subunit
MTCMHIIGTALIAVLIERFVLEGRLGRTDLFGTSTDIAASLPGAGIVAAMLTVGTAGAWLTIPMGSAYCFPVALIGVILAATLAAESMLAQRYFFPACNRTFTRAAILSSLLGIMVFALQVGDTTHHAVSFAKSVGAALQAGAGFAVIRLMYYGARERFVNGRLGAASVAQELTAAGLLALALTGITTLRIFH